MSPTQRLVVLPIIAVAFGLSACSGSDDAADTTAPAPGSDAASTTVAEPSPPESIDPPSTAAEATVASTDPATTAGAPTTEAPTTIAEPTTTESSVAPSTPEEEVAAAIEFFEQQWKECLRTLPDCDTDAVVERRVGEEVSNVQANALRWNQNGYAATNVNALDYRVDDVDIDNSGGAASAVVCVTDPVSLADADGAIVDDEFYTSIVDWELTRSEDGVWRSTTRTTRGEAAVGEENNLCA